MQLKKDQFVRFEEEKQKYKVRYVSEDGRYAICTKPFNPKKTYLYTIIDFKEKIRGTSDLIFGICPDMDDDEGLKEVVIDIVKGRSGISHRNNVSLKIKEVLCTE